MTEIPNRPPGGRLEGDRGTHDGSGAADHDIPFRYGNGKTLLSPKEQLRLIMFKAKAVIEVEGRREMERIKTQEKLQKG